MEEVLTVRVPKGTRRKLEKRARAQNLSLSQYVRRALEMEELLGALEAARLELVPKARSARIASGGRGSSARLRTFQLQHGRRRSVPRVRHLLASSTGSVRRRRHRRGRAVATRWTNEFF